MSHQTPGRGVISTAEQASAPPIVSATESFRSRASVYEHEGNIPGAISQYRALLQRTPGDEDARKRLAELEARRPKRIGA